MRAEVAEAAGELHQALKLYDQGVREATSSLRGNAGDTSIAIAAVDGYFRRAMVLKARIRDGDTHRKATQRAGSEERTTSPGRGGVRRNQQPRGANGTAAATATGAGDPQYAAEVELQTERQQTARLREELAQVHAELADANRNLAQASGRARQRMPIQAVPPNSPSPTPRPHSQDSAVHPASDGAKLEECEMRLNAAVMTEEAALDALTDAAQALIVAQPGDKGLFMRLQCAGWVLCRTSQSGDWDRRWLAVIGDVAELRSAPPGADTDAAAVREVAERAQGAGTAELIVATASLQACGVTRHGTDRIRLALSGANQAEADSSSSDNIEWHFSPAAEASSATVEEQLAAWRVVLEAGARYRSGVATHRDLRLAQAADMCGQASDLLAKGDATAASQVFQRSSEMIMELDDVEVVHARPEVSEAMGRAECGLELAERALAVQARRVDEKVEAAIAPYREELVARCTEIATESAAAAVKEATRRVELWEERAKRAEADLSKSQQAVAQLEIEISKHQQRAGSERAVATHLHRQLSSEHRGGGCCGSKPKRA